MADETVTPSATPAESAALLRRAGELGRQAQLQHQGSCALPGRLHALLQPLVVVDSLLLALACTARHQSAAGLAGFDGFDLVNLAELARRELSTVHDELDELVTVAGGAA